MFAPFARLGARWLGVLELLSTQPCWLADNTPLSSWLLAAPPGRPGPHCAALLHARASVLPSQAMREHRPHALLGFSQGAAAIALLLANLNRDRPPWLAEQPLLFVVMASGFLPRDPDHMELVRSHAAPATPALVIYGAEDKLVPPERAREVYDTLAGACPTEGAIQQWQHDGAHFVPSCGGEFKQLLAAFIDKHGSAVLAAAGKAGQPSAAKQGKQRRPAVATAAPDDAANDGR